MKRVVKIIGIIVLYMLGLCMQLLFWVLKYLDVSELIEYIIFVTSSIPIAIASFWVGISIKKSTLKIIKLFFIFHGFLGLAFLVIGFLYILARFVFS